MQYGNCMLATLALRKDGTLHRCAHLPQEVPTRPRGAHVAQVTGSVRSWTQEPVVVLVAQSQRGPPRAACIAWFQSNDPLPPTAVHRLSQ